MTFLFGIKLNLFLIYEVLEGKRFENWVFGKLYRILRWKLLINFFGGKFEDIGLYRLFFILLKERFFFLFNFNFGFFSWIFCEYFGVILVVFGLCYFWGREVFEGIIGIVFKFSML